MIYFSPRSPLAGSSELQAAHHVHGHAAPDYSEENRSSRTPLPDNVPHARERSIRLE